MSTVSVSAFVSVSALCSVTLLYQILSQYLLNRLFKYCKRQTDRDRDLIYQLRQHLPNLNQWELQIFFRNTYYRMAWFLVFLPVLSPLFVFCRLSGLSSPIRLQLYFEEWIQEVCFRQQIFKTCYSTIGLLKQIKEEDIQSKIYLILSCGHICTWPLIDSEHLTTDQIRGYAYRYMFTKRCQCCSKPIENFVVIRRDSLTKIVLLIKKLDLQTCCITSENFNCNTLIGILPCGHYSEYGPLQRWYRENKRCPYCNLTVNQLVFHRISDTTVDVTRMTDYKIGCILQTIVRDKFSQRQINSFKNLLKMTLDVLS